MVLGLDILQNMRTLGQRWQTKRIIGVMTPKFIHVAFGVLKSSKPLDLAIQLA